jgi:hypothetical protein
MFFPQCEKPSVAFIETGKITALYILIFTFLEKGKADKRILTEW